MMGYYILGAGLICAGALCYVARQVLVPAVSSDELEHDWKRVRRENETKRYDQLLGLSWKLGLGGALVLACTGYANIVNPLA